MAQTNPRRLPAWSRERTPRRLLEDLTPGTVIANGVTNKVLVAVLGARRVRIRARVSVAAGTLKARYLIVRTGGGSFDLDVGPGITGILGAAVPAAVELTFDGVTWVYVGRGIM